MIFIAFVAQLGFGIALPREGPLAPYNSCVTEMLARTPTGALSYDALAEPLERECGRLRDAGLPQAIEEAVARSERSTRPISREDAARAFPALNEWALRATIAGELRARGVDPAPVETRPTIPRTW